MLVLPADSCCWLEYIGSVRLYLDLSSGAPVLGCLGQGTRGRPGNDRRWRPGGTPQLYDAGNSLILPVSLLQGLSRSACSSLPLLSLSVPPWGLLCCYLRSATLLQQASMVTAECAEAPCCFLLCCATTIV